MSEQVNLQEALVKKLLLAMISIWKNLMIIMNSMCKVPPSFQQQERTAGACWYRSGAGESQRQLYSGRQCAY